MKDTKEETEPQPRGEEKTFRQNSRTDPQNGLIHPIQSDSLDLPPEDVDHVVLEWYDCKRKGSF